MKLLSRWWILKWGLVKECINPAKGRRQRAERGNPK
jgi:hypothetical protein